jgi:hypothetical protein
MTSVLQTAFKLKKKYLQRNLTNLYVNGINISAYSITSENKKYYKILLVTAVPIKQYLCHAKCLHKKQVLQVSLENIPGALSGAVNILKTNKICLYNAYVGANNNGIFDISDLAKGLTLF